MNSLHGLLNCEIGGYRLSCSYNRVQNNLFGVILNKKMLIQFDIQHQCTLYYTYHSFSTSNDYSSTYRVREFLLFEQKIAMIQAYSQRKQMEMSIFI